MIIKDACKYEVNWRRKGNGIWKWSFDVVEIIKVTNDPTAPILVNLVGIFVSEKIQVWLGWEFLGAEERREAGILVYRLTHREWVLRNWGNWYIVLFSIIIFYLYIFHPDSQRLFHYL